MPNAAVRIATREPGILRDVRAGLARPQKELPPKYFYDHRGSLLFEAITRLPEYYLTRAERRLLRAWMPPMMRALRPDTLVELGAGSGEKTRIILGAMRDAGSARAYVPVDVSAEFLDASAATLRADLPWLHVAPVVADFTVRVPRPGDHRGTTLFAFLGSTIGNLDAPDAVELLANVARAMGPRDRFLLGADLRTKPIQRIERAYNDAVGLTSEFNLNVLRVLNRELGADFDLSRFRHRAFWSWPHRRIEMHLASTVAQQVRIPGLGAVSLRAGETIRTEICCKYDRDQLDTMLAAAGLAVAAWHVDPRDQYAILLAAPARA
jgi:L-histidine N-alpha-methyltransferase